MRPYEKDYSTQMDITLEMNLDQESLLRNGYTLLDVMSDVGGMQSILVSGLSLMVGLFNYKNFDNYLVTRLYRVKSEKASDGSSCNDSLKSSR